MLAQHPIVADDGNAANQRRFSTTFPDSALERPERRQFRQCTGAIIGRGLDQMDERIVFQPQ